MEPSGAARVRVVQPKYATGVVPNWSRLSLLIGFAHWCVLLQNTSCPIILLRDLRGEKKKEAAAE